MTTIDLNFSTDLTSRNQALNAIANEIKQAFNLVAAGLGDEIDAKARAQFPRSPFNLAVDVRPYAPGKNGYIHFTMVWAPLLDRSVDPDNPTVYGYLVDLRLDLSGSTVTFEQFKTRLRNRWIEATKVTRTLVAWKRALRLAQRIEDGLPDDGATSYQVVTLGQVCWHGAIEYPHHRFADRPEPVVEEVPVGLPSGGRVRTPRGLTPRRR